mgnify:CR=1 FL=1|tara:strand:+ start:513 stop:956 length:444 start_codon:yes stop_codon:yes gene_type:complete
MPITILGHEFSKTLVYSGLMGTFSTIVGQLILSAYLDPIVGTDNSNMIGLIVESIIDYIGQQEIFIKHISTSIVVIIKFIVSKICIILLAQGIFIWLLPIMIVWNKKNKKKIGPEWLVTGTRMIVNISLFFMLTYPLRRYWVFKKTI